MHEVGPDWQLVEAATAKLLLDSGRCEILQRDPGVLLCSGLFWQ